MGQRKKPFALTTNSLVIGLLLLLLITASCGAPSPQPISTGPATISAPTPTFTPPFRALANEPSPTATVEQVALIPTSTPPPATRTAGKTTPTATAAPTVLPYTPLPTFGVYYYPTPDVTYSPVLSNGTQIAYVQDGNLWAIDDDGANPRRLTTSGDIITNGVLAPELVWNNLGDRVAYVSKNNELVIVATQPGAGAPLILKSSAENMIPAQPVWSPDGRSLAFTIRPKELAPYVAGEIWVADFQGAKPTLQKLANGFTPAWSPDGKYLAYLSRVGESDAAAVATPTPAFAIPTPAGTSLLPPTAPATPAPAAGSNALMLYTFGTKRSRPLFLSSDISSVPSLDWKTTYKVQSSVIQALWWSPDSRYIAFADQNSYLGVANAGGGTPVMWAGEPDAFAVRQLSWYPASNGVIFNWNNPGGDDKTYLALISGLGTMPQNAEPQTSPLTSKGRLSILPSEHALCPALSPAGDLIAYTDSKLQALLIVRLDWTIYSLLPGGDCPRWSWDGRYLVTTLRDGENMLATLTPELASLRPMSQTKGASGIYWPRPQQLPLDISALTPASANPPVPGVVAVKPDQISPPPSGSPVRGITPVAGSPVPARPTPRPPTPTVKR